PPRPRVAQAGGRRSTVQQQLRLAVPAIVAALAVAAVKRQPHPVGVNVQFLRRQQADGFPCARTDAGTPVRLAGSREPVLQLHQLQYHLGLHAFFPFLHDGGAHLGRWAPPSLFTSVAAQRWTAPQRAAASSTACARAADASSAVSVRSSARNLSPKASDFLPGSMPVPEYTSKSAMSSSSSPAPSRNASRTASAGTDESTTKATSWVESGKVDRCLATITSAAASNRASPSSSMAAVRAGRSRSASSFGCSSPA